MQLPSGKHGLEHVSGIQRAVRLACSHDGVQLVYKEDNLAVAVLHILQHRFQTLLKFSPVLCAGHQRAHIQGKYFLVLQPLWYVSSDNPLCQPFHYRSLTHAGLADENRIVFRFPGKDTDDVSDLGIPADDRVQFLISGLLHQFLAVFLQGVIGCLRVVAGHSLVAPDRGQRLEKPLPGNAVLLPYLRYFPIGVL